MTVAELIDALSNLNPDAEVRIAHQPRWAFEYDVENVAQAEAEPGEDSVVYIAEGNQLGYLPQNAADAIGW